MNTLDSTLPANARSASLPATARILFTLLERMDFGALTLTTPDGITRRFGPGGAVGALDGEVDLTLRDWKLCGDVLTGGDVAFAEAFMDDRWETSDLTALLTLIALNQRALEVAFYGRWWRQLVFRAKHLLRSNTKRRARRNVVAHYDLGNDFYGLWLDSTMSYSSALFGGDLSGSLASAQEAKYERVLQQLAPKEGAHLLEIGCGWGSFAECAARAGCRVTAVSLSDAQTAYARERVAAMGPQSNIDFCIKDYRDVAGQFDGIASIEMFEAVGERYWPAYFRAVREALKPGARACVQTITIANDRFEQYRQTSDFIQQYIFPGGMLASPDVFDMHVAAAGLEVDDVHRFGQDYAETLKRWVAAFDANVDKVRAQGFDHRFIRCWRFYLAYCAAGFASETTDVAQYTLVAP
ncbi:MAG TPA: cyclopropane-fatty-acyl-phospholipid synthase family protein [Casimicrobiaceae bacterium]|nr:cyclopropane-fatty-acyl-phospholipid synthase family protein [Casimicrobiaceae bacterium]